MSILTNFSVRNENSTLEENTPNISKIFDNDLSLSQMSVNNDINNNYIVYNIESEFLIPIKIIKDEKNQENEITIIFVDNKIKSLYGDKITINKNDIYYELIENFDLVEDISNSKYINDLNILYNIQLNLLNGNNFFYIGNVLNIINQNSKKESCKILINNMFKISRKDEICFIYQKYGDNNNNIDFELFLIDSFLTYNEYYINYQYNNSIIKKCFQLISLIKDINLFFSITQKLKIIPVFPTNLKNYLYNQSIIFKNSNEGNKLLLKDEIQNYLTNISIELDYYEGNELFINLLYSIFVNELKENDIFNNCITIFITAYKEFLNKNFFYSNICILTLLVYAFGEFGVDNNIKNHLLILYNSSNLEDDSLLNEILRQQSIVYNKKTFSNNLPLNKYIAFYLENNLNNFESIIENDKKLLQNIKDNEFYSDFSFLEEKINVAKYSNILEYFRKITLSKMNNLFNKKYKNSIQIFDLYQLSSLEEFKTFIQNIDSIPEFYNLTHMVKYAKMYKDYNFNEKLLLRKFNMNNEIYFIDYIRKIIKIQAFIKGKNVFELINDLKNKTRKIQNTYRLFKYKQYKKISCKKILELGLQKYKKKDKLTYRLCNSFQNTILDLEKNNLILKNKLKNDREPILNKKFIIKSYENFTDSQSNIFDDEKKKLINEYNKEIENYSNLVQSSENYISKMTKIFTIINNNSKIKEIFAKNNIELI